MSDESKVPRLHVYAQSSSHGDAWLVGNRASLAALRDAITDVLDGPLPGSSVLAFAADGEGYATLVLLHEEPGAWDRLLLPYAALEDKREDATHPFSEMARDLYKTVLSRG